MVPLTDAGNTQRKGMRNTSSLGCMLGIQGGAQAGSWVYVPGALEEMVSRDSVVIVYISRS